MPTNYLKMATGEWEWGGGQEKIIYKKEVSEAN